ncbi:MAG TPA: pitrilysin family protein [Candidatus Margulisiibacteriota bacterium]|nr:pitrilysin family protein [Candidatus Margulisiibacteriota bacterium]
MRLIVSEQHALPMVVVQVLVDAGARRDPAGKEGVASLTADLLTEGTRSRTASQIKEAVDFIGAGFDTSADTDFAMMSLTVLRNDLETGLGLLTDVLLHPTFPEAEVVRRREAALATIKANEDNPGSVAQRAFVEAVFRGEPYGHVAIGTAVSVQRLTRADVEAFYKQHYRPDGTIIVVAGDVTAADIEQRLQRALAEWQTRQAEPFQYPPVKAAHPETVSIDKPITQANVLLGHRGVARDNPDYYALTVMNFILGGGGFTSRLLDNIRTKAGLAYSVASYFVAGKSPGSFQVSLQTKNESATDAIARSCAELERIRNEPVSDEELADAKLYLTGSFPLKLDSTAKIASFLAQVEFFNLGADYADTYVQRINAVTKEDVLRVARQYLHPDELELVVVANLDQAKVSGAAPCSGTP